MAELGDGLNGYLDVQDATLRAPRLEAVSNISIANTNPQHAFSVGSNLYVSTESSDVLAVNGNVLCEGIKMGFLEIIPSYDLAAVSNVGNVTQSTIQFANATTGFVTTAGVEIGGGTVFSGHILPSADNTYDIGSAAFKIRDMYVSDNSLWIGDDTKLSVTGGELKFRKRNTGVVPKGITDMGGSGSAALSHAGVADINDMKLHHWEAYAKSVDATKTTKDIFTDDAENYETSAIKTFNTSNAMTIGTTKTFVVTVSDASGANKYYIDGIQQPALTLHRHQTYIFDLSSSTLATHPFIFSETVDGTGTNYDTGSETLRTFVVPADAPATLYYYCTAHPGMGATVSISSEAELIVSGRIECIGTTGISLGGGTTAQRPTYAPLGSMRYNSTTGYMEAYTGSGWGALATPPSIVSISPTSVLVADTATQVFTVSGASFDSGLAINLVGANGTNYEVVDMTFVNAATTTFKMGDLSSATDQVANRPYTVKITGGSGLAATSTQTIGFSGTAWTSPAAGATLSFSTSSSVSYTLAGTNAVGGTSGRTFAVAPGSNPLPGGLSLNASSGVISGTIGALNSGTNVTFRVVDTPSQSFVERTFNITGLSGLYSFTSHTFTNAAATGRFGPTFAQMKTAYNSTVWYNTPAWFNEVSGKRGLQLWTVPKTGTYRIKAYGGKGGPNGDSTHYGGNGGYCMGDFPLSGGEKLIIIVGHHGVVGPYGSGSAWVAGGGGGGSYVLKESYLSDPQIESIYIVAGGGGGGGYKYTGGGGGNQPLDIDAAVHIGSGNSGYGHGPGGGVRYNGTPVAIENNNTATKSSFGRSAYNGSLGGTGGYGNVGSYYYNEGSFGGGGGTAPHTGGGGGGYSGGDTSEWNIGPGSGGGTSYVSTYPHNQVGNRSYGGTHSSSFGTVVIQAPGTF